ncbi:HNH endonuclease signature motif containing protein [Rhizobium phaseoli]|uniref:HNH endonuclease protein n=1 Tax=Rhizobium phaseoli TaxID=396 RepID=A0ABN4QGC4_9HYPH|nr:HNH endonuclease signature motif containing protein [Rhizobium phaseoli]ANL84620.1 HNH endonuclease protein [Rhizobium phaseoli]ANL91127.1 HNH endonuclease protein [Rhizobium phaseoli]
MSRREFSRATRQAALKRSGLKCEASGSRYGLEEGQRCNCSLSLGVQYDHDVPDQLGGDNSLENCRAVCVQCHKIKTRGDIQQIRKSDRQRDKASGVVRPAGKIKSAPFPKSPKAAGRQAKNQLPPRPLFRPAIEEPTP